METDWLRRTLDPALFSDTAVDAETASINAGVEAVLAKLPSQLERSPLQLRAEREAGEGVWGPLELDPAAVERQIPGPAGPVPVRIVAPERPRGVYLHFHGGGWVLGAAHHFDRMHRAIADTCGLAVVSVDYRLAPEHPYPAGPDDCEAAARWLIEHAPAEFGTDRLIVGGESAGAHLGVVTLLRLRDRHGFRGFRAANLVYGCYDVGLTPSAMRWGERNLILSTPILHWFADHFVPVERRREPDVSPLYADLTGMPPALITVGTLDPLLDDSLFLHTRWAAAGGEAELAVYPGGIHGFNAFPSALATRANARIAAFLRDAA